MLFVRMEIPDLRESVISDLETRKWNLKALSSRVSHAKSRVQREELCTCTRLTLIPNTEKLYGSMAVLSCTKCVENMNNCR